jgi:hypothetical protein
MDAGAIQNKLGDDDVLLGHAHPKAGYIFRNSLQGFHGKKIMLSPLTPNRECDWAWDIEAIDHVDAYIALTGSAWWPEIMSHPEWSKHRKKLTRIDMAINCDDYPMVKRKFNDIGKRRILFIGCCLPVKGPDFLNKLAAEFRCVFFHVGAGTIGENVLDLGSVDFSKKETLDDLAREFDFIIAPGVSDACPTTMIESMAWGLIPICSTRSGWTQKDGCTLIPYGDVPGSAKIIDSLLHRKKCELEFLRDQNSVRVKLYNWDSFTATILNVADSVLK